jgi:hypothetical protein
MVTVFYQKNEKEEYFFLICCVLYFIFQRMKNVKMWIFNSLYFPAFSRRLNELESE